MAGSHALTGYDQDEETIWHKEAFENTTEKE